MSAMTMNAKNIWNAIGKRQDTGPSTKDMPKSIQYEL
jgi:hypothetical protein